MAMENQELTGLAYMYGFYYFFIIRFSILAFCATLISLLDNRTTNLPLELSGTSCICIGLITVQNLYPCSDLALHMPGR